SFTVTCCTGANFRGILFFRLPRENIMMRLFVFTLAATLACTAFAADRSEAAFAADRYSDAARNELRTIAQYPKDVREAILELLNQPELLNKLEGDKDLDNILKGQKPAVADAARVV